MTPYFISVLLALLTTPSALMLPFLPGTCVVTFMVVPAANLPVPVGSTIAVYGPAPSVVTMCRVPEKELLTCGRVEPDWATADWMSDRVLAPPPVVRPRPLVAALVEEKTVVSTSVLELDPAPGTTAPWMPSAVVLPPASPCWRRLSECGCESGMVEEDLQQRRLCHERRQVGKLPELRGRR